MTCSYCDCSDLNTKKKQICDHSYNLNVGAESQQGDVRVQQSWFEFEGQNNVSQTRLNIRASAETLTETEAVMATCDNYSDSPEGENEVKTKLNV